jgi:uncharacterized repeat protein (TIGR01451 family)
MVDLVFEMMIRRVQESGLVRVVSGGVALSLALSIVIIGVVLALIVLVAMPLSPSAVEAQSCPLIISKSASPDPSVSGDELTYILNITNTSAVALMGVVVSDSTPIHTTFLGASGPDLWRMTSPAYGGEGTVTWTAPAPLEPGQTAQLRFLVRVKAPDLEPIVNFKYEARAEGLERPVPGEPLTTTVILPTPTFTPPPTALPIPTPSPTATITLTVERAEPTQSAPSPQPAEPTVGQSGLQDVGKVIIVLVVIALVAVSATVWVARGRK